MLREVVIQLGADLSGLAGQVEHLLEAVRGRAQVLRRRKSLRPLERKLQQALARAFRRQGAAVLRAMEAYRPRLEPVADALLEASRPLDPAEWDELFEKLPPAVRNAFEGPLEDGLRAALLAGGRNTLEFVDLARELRFSLDNPAAVEFLAGRAAELVRQIDETTREQLAELVTRGVERGKAYSAIAAEIRQRFAEMGALKPQKHIRDRATLIAVTELGNAYSESTLIVGKDLAAGGLEMVKSWMTIGDDRVTDACTSNQAQGWIPVDQAFSSGHDRPLRFPGCRCNLLVQRKASAKAGANFNRNRKPSERTATHDTPALQAA